MIPQSTLEREGDYMISAGGLKSKRQISEASWKGLESRAFTLVFQE